MRLSMVKQIMQRHFLKASKASEFSGGFGDAWTLAFQTSGHWNIRSTFRGSLIAVILLLFSTPSPLFAQASTGAVAQITGSVSDSTGAVVPGAEVKATQTDTGFTRTAVTGTDGTYVLPTLIVGPYELQVVSSGFKTYFQKGIVLQVNDNATVGIELQIGATSESVAVNANVSMVNTESSSVSSVIEHRRVVDLPLNGRDLTQLVLLSGAAVQTNYGDSISSKNYPTSHTITVAGGKPLEQAIWWTAAARITTSMEALTCHCLSRTRCRNLAFKPV